MQAKARLEMIFQLKVVDRYIRLCRSRSKLSFAFEDLLFRRCIRIGIPPPDTRTVIQTLPDTFAVLLLCLHILLSAGEGHSSFNQFQLKQIIFYYKAIPNTYFQSLGHKQVAHLYIPLRCQNQLQMSNMVAFY